MNLIALAKVAYDAAGVEDVGQLTKDGLVLDQLYEKEKSGLNLGDLTEAELDEAIPAIGRVMEVLNALWKVPSKRKDIINAVKGL